MSEVRLNSPVEVLYGIGPEAARKLARLGIATVYDLISYLPRRYNDWSNVSTIDTVEIGREISFIGVVSSNPVKKGVKRNAPVSFRVKDNTGSIELAFFNMPYIINKYSVGDTLFVHGLVEYFGMKPQITNPFIEKYDKLDEFNLIRPVYSLTAGVTSLNLSKWIKTALKLVSSQLQDIIPEELSRSADLCSVQESYNFVHFPNNLYEAARGRKRIAYEELILLGVGMKHFMNSEDKSSIAPVVVPDVIPDDISVRWKRVISNLGFQLTDDQRNALRDIQKDLMLNKPMNRLVQGDVGSGKTAVAVLAMAMTALMGKQAVLLAPTSVLASQHYQTAVSLLEGSGINVVLLLGKTKASLKKEIKEKLKTNEANVIIGTHAVLSDDVQFADLALVIADEQHRFGVKQREKLLIRGGDESGLLNGGINAVHNLVMTATPIPRTLGMVIYGDMDTSVIKQKPAGRKEIRTHFLPSDKVTELATVLAGRIDAGEQIYIVAPRIDDDEEELMVDDVYYSSDHEASSGKSMASVKQTYKMLESWGITARYKTEMLYGSMKENKKLEIMEDFISGNTKILISTTVIEVGVNNPDATVMIILDADNFGLSTLHQLRGRIGRGDKQSYCILVSGNRSELALQRIKMMCETSDGFELAGKDLELRGPGDFFGTRQHGIPSLRAANLFTDMDIAKDATEAVNLVFERGGEEADKLMKAIEFMFKLRFSDRMNSL